MICDEILQFTQVSVNSFIGMLYHNLADFTTSLQHGGATVP